MRKIFVFFIVLLLATPAMAEIVTLKIENPTTKRLWLADVRKP